MLLIVKACEVNIQECSTVGEKFLPSVPSFNHVP